MSLAEHAMTGVVVLKAVNELFLLTLAGQGALWLLAGSRRHENMIYGAFNLVGARIFRAFRCITFGRVPDRHLPALSFIGLLCLEMVLIVAKILLFVEIASRQT